MHIHVITIICYTLVRVGFPLKASLECHLANTKLLLDSQEMNPKIKKKKKCMDVVDHFVLRNYYVYGKLPPVWQWSYVLAGWVPKAGKNRSVGGPMAIPLADYLVKLWVGCKYLIFLGWATRVTTMVVDQIWLVSWRPVDVAFKVADVHQAFRTFSKLLSDLWWTETKSSLLNICQVTEPFVVNWDDIKLSKHLSSYGAICGELRRALAFLRNKWGAPGRCCSFKSLTFRLQEQHCVHRWPNPVLAAMVRCEAWRSTRGASAFIAGWWERMRTPCGYGFALLTIAAMAIAATSSSRSTFTKTRPWVLCVRCRPPLWSSKSRSKKFSRFLWWSWRKSGLCNLLLWPSDQLLRRLRNCSAMSNVTRLLRGRGDQTGEWLIGK